MKPLRLEILFGSQDKLSPALKMITGSSKSSALALKKTRDELKNLESQQKKIDGYLKQKQALEGNTIALQTMHEKLAQLRKDMANNTTEKLIADLNNAKGKLSATNAEIKRLTDQQKKIDLFSSQKKSLLETQKSYDALKLRIKALKQEMQNDSSAKMSKDFAAATKQAERFKNKIEQQSISLQRSRDALKEVGLSTQGLARTQSQLRNTMEQLNVSQTKQTSSINSLKKASDDEKKSLDQLSKQFNSTEKDAKKLENTIRDQKQKLQELKNGLNSSGTSTHNLAEQQKGLAQQINTANSSLEAQKSKLKNLNQIQQSHNKFKENAKTAALYGTAATGTGVATMYSMRKPIDESKKYELEQNRIGALNFGDKTNKAYIDHTKKLEAFGVSQVEKLSLARDALTVFSDPHHAEMVLPTFNKLHFANSALYGQESAEANDHELMDLMRVVEERGGLKSSADFERQANMMQKVKTGSGNRVTATDYLHATKRGGVAMKGMSEEALYYKSEPLIQLLGGDNYGTSIRSAYQNLIQGKTTKKAANKLDHLGLIADERKVHHDKIGKDAYFDVGALKGSDLYIRDPFEWVKTVLIPQLKAKGITKQQDVINTIAGIITNSNGANVITEMYLKQAQIEKNTTTHARAESIDQVYERAQKTATGKEIEAQSKLHDAYLTFGQNILPIYSKALTFATNELQVFTTWMQKNPTLTKILGVGLLGVAASLIAIGGALVVFSPLLMGLMSLRLIMTSVGATGSVLGFAFKMLLSPFKLLGGAVVWLGGIFKAAGVFLLENPIIFAITAIAVAAYLIYRNWAPIKSFFSDIWNSISIWASETWQSITTSASQTWTSITGFFSGIGDWFSQQWQSVSNTSNDVWLSISNGASQAWNTVTNVFSPIGTWFGDRWNDIKTAFNGGILGVSSLILNWSPMGLFYSVFAKVLSWFGVDLPSQFTGFGSMIIDGLVHGLEQGFDKLKSVWTTINSWMPDWTRKTMDIHSPSRVMAGLGGYIVSGLGMGIDGGTSDLQNKFNNILSIFQQNPQFGKNNSLRQQLDPIHQINLSRSANLLDPISSIESIVTKVRNIGAPTTQAAQAIPQQTAGNTYHVTFEMKGQQTPQDLFNEFQAWIQRKERKAQAAQRDRFLDDY